MSLLKKANVIIYRFKERGLEIFLVDADDKGKWEFPNGEVSQSVSTNIEHDDKLIALDPVQQTNGDVEEALAVEGDWHEIPSLKNMLYEDAIEAKKKIKHIEKGGFFALKEALKKVMPHQYEFLKELKDILTDRNSVQDL